VRARRAAFIDILCNHAGIDTIKMRGLGPSGTIPVYSALARGRVCSPSPDITAVRIAPRHPVVSAVLAVVMARKAKSGARRKKSGFSPTDATRRGEIVEEILVWLRPWKHRVSEAAVIAAVNQHLDLLLLLPPDVKLFDRRLYRAHAKELDCALLKVETLVASAPGALALALFDPVTITENGVLMVPSSINQIKRLYRKRADSFAGELKRLRKVCAGAIDPGFGFHPNYDPVKTQCAWIAHYLMKELSNMKISGTKDGAFWTITSLLYEAVSGQKNAALKRACDTALRDIRRCELGTD
jgi:hypothetical protein